MLEFQKNNHKLQQLLQHPQNLPVLSEEAMRQLQIMNHLQGVLHNRGQTLMREIHDLNHQSPTTHPQSPHK
jgi:hypothetical protein